MNHYPHHIGDFAKDTLGFNQGAIGAYRLLMDAYYANEQAPAVDEVYVIGRAITPSERKNVDRALTKFDLKDGRYYHKRVEEELIAYRERSEQAKKNIAKRYEKPTKRPTERSTDEVLASSHKPVTKPTEKRFPSDNTIPEPEPRLAALSAICLRLRVNPDGHKALMHLRQWIAEGVTDEQFTDAILLARDRKPDPEIIPIAYLAPIVSDLRAGKVRARPQTQEETIAAAMASIAAKESANAAH